VVESDDEEKPFHNPLNLPLGWDGKPIPFWLYKLHGLGIEYPAPPSPRLAPPRPVHVHVHVPCRVVSCLPRAMLYAAALQRSCGYSVLRVPTAALNVAIGSHLALLWLPLRFGLTESAVQASLASHSTP
jgi:hypothetical protein